MRRQENEKKERRNETKIQRRQGRWRDNTRGLKPTHVVAHRCRPVPWNDAQRMHCNAKADTATQDQGVRDAGCMRREEANMVRFWLHGLLLPSAFMPTLRSCLPLALSLAMRPVCTRHLPELSLLQKASKGVPRRPEALRYQLGPCAVFAVASWLWQASLSA